MATIIIVGLARSGKDTAADYIAKKYGYKKYTFSAVLREALEKKGLVADKAKMIELGDSLRKEFGMDAVAKLLDKKITEKDNIILVGPRSVEEISYFRKKFPKLFISKVMAKDDERFLRKTELDPAARDEFFARDEEDKKKKGFRKALASAGFELKNHSTKQKLYSQIDALMKRTGD